jgi:hypothetical protein
MKVEIKPLSAIDWDVLAKQGESYLYSAESLGIYQHLDLLALINGKDLCAIWPIPYMWNNEHKIAQREMRLLPHHPPLLFKNHLLQERKMMSILIAYLKQHYYAIDLPLGPCFHHTTPFFASGMFVEWRNTHRFSVSHSLWENLHAKVKNHIRFAEKNVMIKRGEEFDFDKGIVTQEKSHRLARKQLASHFLASGKGEVFSAWSPSGLEGQALVVHDRQTGYLFHSWFKKESIRGVPSYLIATIADWVLKEKQLAYFDLEGSIIPTIDHFFSCFGGIQTPYAYIIWCKEREKMLKLIENTLFLPLRLSEK